MSKRQDRERAKSGYIFRDGQMWHKPEYDAEQEHLQQQRNRRKFAGCKELMKVQS